jgi:drug/metabolite transporter (DMT)-like permease
LQVSVNTILGQSAMLIFFIISLVIFKEASTLVKFLGVFLLVIGNVFVVGAMKATGKMDTRGVVYRLIASVALAVGMLSDSVNSPNYSIGIYAFITYFISGLFTWVIARVSLKEIINEFKTNWKFQLVMTSFSAIGYYFFIKALAIGPKSVVVPVNNVSGVIVVILGIFLLKERDHFWRKIIATALAFAGAVLLSI